MDISNIVEEINTAVIKAITPGMSEEERQALREKITHEILSDKAKLANLCPDEVKKLWGEISQDVNPFKALARKLGL